MLVLGLLDEEARSLIVLVIKLSLEGAHPLTVCCAALGKFVLFLRARLNPESPDPSQVLTSLDWVLILRSALMILGSLPALWFDRNYAAARRHGRCQLSQKVRMLMQGAP